MRKWFTPSSPKNIQPIPWLSPQAVDYLESILKPDYRVLEFGSGGSTLWFAERVFHVDAVEANSNWRRAVQKQLTNGHKVYANLKEMDLFNTPPVDLLLIDGEPVEARAHWIEAAPAMVKRGGWIVLDNANRPEYENEREGLKAHCRLVETFDGNVYPTLYLVTEFWQCPE